MKLKIITGFDNKCLLDCPFYPSVKIGSHSCAKCKHYLNNSNLDFINCSRADELISTIAQIKYETKDSSN